MRMHLFIEYLDRVKRVQVQDWDSVLALKTIVQLAYGIDVACQRLTLFNEESQVRFKVS